MPSNSGARFWSQIVPSLPSSMKPQLDITVQVEGHDDAKVYTSGSAIAGCVTVVSQQELDLESVKILLTGISTTNMVSYHNDLTQSRHTFLELIMPDSQQDAMQPSTFIAGKSYRFPFVFVVPHQLTTTSCRFTSDTAVHQRHLQLPPTVGSWQHSEQGPYAARIQYAVQAKAITGPKNSDKQKVTEVSHPLKIIPASLEPASPDPVLENEENQLAVQLKQIRGDMFSPYIGYLKATIRDPSPAILSLNDLGLSGTCVTLDLEFYPSGESARSPNIRVKSAVIQAVTHYSRAHISHLPGRQKYPEIPDVTATSHFANTECVVECKGKLLWQQGRNTTCTESLSKFRDEQHQNDRKMATTTKMESQINKSAVAAGRTSIQYTAALTFAASVSSSTKKIFLPSFDTCLLSRNYRIRVTLVAGASGTTLSLFSPLEVVTETSYSPQPPLCVEYGRALDPDKPVPPPYHMPH